MQILCVPAAYQVTTRSRGSGLKPHERTGANRRAAAARVRRWKYLLCPSRVTVRQMGGNGP
jgi:hypothetical protein